MSHGLFPNRPIHPSQDEQAAAGLDSDLFSKVFRACPDSITIASMEDGTYLEVNDVMLGLMGLDRNQVIGHSALELDVWVDPEDRQRFLDELARTGAVRHFETRFRMGTGQILDFEVSSEIIQVHGKPHSFNFMKEITTSRKLARSLRESEVQFRSLFDQAPIGMAVVASETGLFLSVNERMGTILGYEAASLVGHAFQEFTHPDDLPADVSSVHDLVIGNLQEVEKEKRYLDRAGKVVWGRLKMVKLAPAPDGTARHLSLVEDISERKLAEEALRKSEKDLIKAQQVAQVGSWAWNIKANRLEWSDEMYRIFGIEKEGFKGVLSEVIAQAIHPDDRAAVERSNLSVIQRGTPVPLEYRIIWPDGTVRVAWAEAGEMILDEAGTPAVLTGIVQDITDRKRAEESMRESENRYRSLVASLSEGIVQSDRDGAILAWNAAAERILGLSGDQLRGLTIFDPRWEAVREDGTAFPIDERPARVAMLTGREQRNKIYAIRKADGPLTWISANAAPVFIPGASMPSSVVTSFTDITERRMAEEEKTRLQAQFQQSQKMESLGTLAGGVAHDMNNVLGAILALSSTHLANLPQDSPYYSAFETIRAAATRGGDMVKRLLAFSRQTPSERQELNLNTLLLEEARLLERTTLAKVRVEMDLAPDLHPILGDGSALAHALMNLCINAVDAMGTGGTLSLRTCNLGTDKVEVSVKDNGSGMTREVMDRALDPFFTTKAVGKGTGLGLSLVFTTVKAHGGHLAIESEPGRGTRVTLTFPSTVAQAPAPGPEAPAWQAEGARAIRVLLVDDDELIQKSTRMLVEALGHTVTEAACGEGALALLEQGFQPDAVILDMNMPGLGGKGTLPRLRGLCPTVPVLLATGRPDQEALDLVAAYPWVTLLSKPFSFEELQSHLLHLAGGGPVESPGT